LGGVGVNLDFLQAEKGGKERLKACQDFSESMNIAMGGEKRRGPSCAQSRRAAIPSSLSRGHLPSLDAKLINNPHFFSLTEGVNIFPSFPSLYSA